MKTVVYDHKGKHGVLRKWAEEKALSSGDVLVFTQDSQNVAVRDMVQSDCELLLVHLEEEHWASLIEKLDKQQSACRFSTVGFLPTPPAGRYQNGFHVNPRTENDNGKPESPNLLPDFFSSITQEGTLPTLRKGIVPLAIRQFISFHQPHFAHALHILIQGRLAQWAGDSTHPNCGQAKQLLELGNPIPRLNHEIDWQHLLRTLLSCCRASASSPASDQALIDSGLKSFRREMGLEGDFDKTPVKEIRELLQVTLSQGSTEENPAVQKSPEQELFRVLKTAWDELAKLLHLPEREGS